MSLRFDPGFRVMPCGRFLYGANAQAYFAALREQPDDFLRRQVFADWLEEHSPYRGHLLRAQGIRVACQGNPDQKRITKAASKWLGEHAVVLWPHLRALASGGAGFRVSRSGRWVIFQAKLASTDPGTGRRPVAPHPTGRSFQWHRVVLEFRGGFVVKASYDRWSDFYALGPAVAADEPLADVDVQLWDPDCSTLGGGRIEALGLFQHEGDVVMVAGDEVGLDVVTRLNWPLEIECRLPRARAWRIGIDAHFLSHATAYSRVQKLRQQVMHIAGEMAREVVANQIQAGTEPGVDPFTSNETPAGTTAG